MGAAAVGGARCREAATSRPRGRAGRGPRPGACGAGRHRRPRAAAGGAPEGLVRGNRYLYCLVFMVGISTLGAEIAAARLLAPFFGASTIVWANTIGVVLVALSIGYWWGGRLG